MRIEDKKPGYFYRLPLEARIYIPISPELEEECRLEREEAERRGISTFEVRNGRPPTPAERRAVRRHSLVQEWARRGY